MIIDQKELNRRKPLWSALSDLFLDNVMQESGHVYVAKIMKESGYTLTEIENILMVEVFPVCIRNRLITAGEWGAFGEEWLVERILNTKKPNLFHRCLNRIMYGMIKKDWLKIVELYKQIE